jgi:hypothetical protein
LADGLTLKFATTSEASLLLADVSSRWRGGGNQ